MKALSAMDAKNDFGRLINTARAQPVIIQKHGRPVVVVLAVEEYERLTRLAERPNNPSAGAIVPERESWGAPG